MILSVLGQTYVFIIYIFINYCLCLVTNICWFRIKRVCLYTGVLIQSRESRRVCLSRDRLRSRRGRMFRGALWWSLWTLIWVGSNNSCRTNVSSDNTLTYRCSIMWPLSQTLNQGCKLVTFWPKFAIFMAISASHFHVVSASHLCHVSTVGKGMDPAYSASDWFILMSFASSSQSHSWCLTFRCSVAKSAVSPCWIWVLKWRFTVVYLPWLSCNILTTILVDCRP